MKSRKEILFKEKISEYLKGHGICVSPDSILIVSGAIQALQLISMGLLPKGASILLENHPIYIRLMFFNPQECVSLEYQWMRTV